MQAVGLPSLDEAPGPRLRDLPDPVRERPSYMKRRARQLLYQAARLADASTLDADQRAEIARMQGEADRLLEERAQKLTDLERAVSLDMADQLVDTGEEGEGRVPGAWE